MLLPVIAFLSLLPQTISINFNTTGYPIAVLPNGVTTVTQFNQYALNWLTVDAYDTTPKYTGAFMITVSGQSNNCGGAIIKTWDPEGLNPSITPNASLPVYGVTSGRCFLSLFDDSADIALIQNLVETITLQVVFKRYLKTKVNPAFSVYTQVSSVVFASVSGMDVAIITMGLTVGSALSSGLAFYPLMRSRLPALSAISAISYLDIASDQIHYMRASYNSHVTSNDSFTFSNGKLVNKYAFGITATFKSTGAAVLYKDSTGVYKIAGVAVEESVTTSSNQPLPLTSTKNFATWTNEFVDCWDLTGLFSLYQPGCLKHFSLDYILTYGVNLVGAKNMVKDSVATVNVTSFSVLAGLNVFVAANLNTSSVTTTSINDKTADGVSSSATDLKSALYFVVLMAVFIL